MHTAVRLPKYFLFALAAVILFSAGPASAIEKPRRGEDILLDTYYKNIARLEKNSFGIPLFLESSEQGDGVRADVYGVFNYTFGSVAGALSVPANLCDILSLHPNVKACTYSGLPGAWILTLYIGRKTYQKPKDARQVIYRYRNVEQTDRYLDISLSADTGPFGTKDHKMRLEAMPIEGGRTFIHVSYAYSDSVALRLAERVYYATLGRGKVGFTVIGMESNGEPVYIGGPRGVVERSSARYYLAVKAFMDTLSYPSANRFNVTAVKWYDLAARYRRQLFDVERNDYIASKADEHKNQEMLQRSIGQGLR